MSPTDETLATSQAAAEEPASVASNDDASDVAETAASTEITTSVASPSQELESKLGGEIPVVDETTAGPSEFVPPPGGDIMALHKRITALEDVVKKSNDTIQKLTASAAQAQQISNALVGMLNNLNMRVSGLDPNVAVLEVTLVDEDPVIADEEKEKKVALKVAIHNKTHPEKPNQLDVLRLDKSDPEAPHWVPSAVTPVLGENIRQQLTEAGVGEEQWQWVVIKEIPREHGQTALVISGKREDKAEIAPAEPEAPVEVDV